MPTLNASSFNNFLKAHKSASGEAYTHTSMGDPLGCYVIRDDELDEFFKIYHNAVFENGQKTYMTEGIRDRTYTPFRVDLDFRYFSDSNLRIYNIDDIVAICQIYMEIIEEYLVEPDNDERIFFIMEKPEPVPDIDKSTKLPKTNDKGETRYKDGVHIMAPFITINVNLGLKLREYVYRNCARVLDKYPLDNSYADIFDRAIIDKNNWQMYGSRKPGCEAYKVSHIFRIWKDRFEMIPLDSYSDIELISILSVRNKNMGSVIRVDKEAEVFEAPPETKRRARNTRKRTINKIPETELKVVLEYVDCLTIERARSYQTWIEVGWALHNIHNHDDTLLHAWIDFSKKAAEYEHSAEDECTQLWASFLNEGYGIGSLKLWAKTDNPEYYSQIVQHDIQHQIILACKTAKSTEYDVAKVVYHMYKDLYKCVSSKGNGDWYYYDQSKHRWIHDNGGTLLRRKFSNEVYREFSKVHKFFQEQTVEADDEFARRSQKISKVMERLGNTPFKNNVLTECKELFYDPPGDKNSFANKLDNRDELICFNDGVYDLNKEEFRKGRPEDYISMCTNISFFEYDPECEEIKAIYKFINKVLLIKSVREYTMRRIASGLNGANKDQLFDIWSGSGGNGKSKLVNLIELALGDYAVKLPVQVLTQKRGSSSGPSPEIIRTKGRRFATLQEPDEHTRLNVGVMKELSGGDKIIARALFCEPVEFTPKFKLFLLCNQRPELPPKDDGTWRRLRLTEFISKFTYKPDPTIFYQFKGDNSIDELFESWKEPFMAILIHYYKIYKRDGLPTPDEITEYTNIYKQSNDHFLQFINDCVVPCPESTESIPIMAIYEIYKAWYKINNSDSRCKKQSDLKAYMDEKFGVKWKPGSAKTMDYKGIKVALPSSSDSSAAGITMTSDDL